MFRIKNIHWKVSLALVISFAIQSCRPIDLYEKTVAIPGHAWKGGFQPSFTFTIRDTTSPYQVYFIIRHNDQYNYRNIYINLSVKKEGQDSLRTRRLELELSNDENGWHASGMDDIYEHRIPLFPINHPGTYTFTVQQVMREDPLQHVFDAGIRVEKK